MCASEVRAARHFAPGDQAAQELQLAGTILAVCDVDAENFSIPIRVLTPVANTTATVTIRPHSRTSWVSPPSHT